jgi:hypothetical protein
VKKVFIDQDSPEARTTNETINDRISLITVQALKTLLFSKKDKPR